MGTYRHTGVGNGEDRTDYAAYGQLRDAITFVPAGQVAGTASAITLAPEPAFTSWPTGGLVLFLAEDDIEANATVALNAIAAVNIVRHDGGSATVQVGAGDIQAGELVALAFDGTAAHIAWTASGGCGPHSSRAGARRSVRCQRFSRTARSPSRRVAARTTSSRAPAPPPPSRTVTCSPSPTSAARASPTRTRRRPRFAPTCRPRAAARLRTSSPTTPGRPRRLRTLTASSLATTAPRRRHAVRHGGERPRLHGRRLQPARPRVRRAHDISRTMTAYSLRPRAWPATRTAT